MCLILLGAFGISTFFIYERRPVVTKSMVKSMDYVTIFTFVAALVPVAEIDTKSARERANLAASEIDGVQRDLQEKLKSHPYLQHCDDFKLPTKLDFAKIKEWPAFVRPYAFCLAFSGLVGVELSQVPKDSLDRRVMFLPVVVLALPTDPASIQIFNTFAHYNFLRGSVAGKNPIGIFIPQSLVYLLLGFAISVRLSRTTVEVFEWHRK
jgi:hypothetical protein